MNIKILLLVFLPLISSYCAGLFGRFLGPFGSSYITVFCLISTFFISLFNFYEVALLNCCVYIKLGPWLNSELLNRDWGFMFESLTVKIKSYHTHFRNFFSNEGIVYFFSKTLVVNE